MDAKVLLGALMHAARVVHQHCAQHRSMKPVRLIRPFDPICSRPSKRDQALVLSSPPKAVVDAEFDSGFVCSETPLPPSAFQECDRSGTLNKKQMLRNWGLCSTPWTERRLSPASRVGRRSEDAPPVYGRGCSRAGKLGPRNYVEGDALRGRAAQQNLNTLRSAGLAANEECSNVRL